MDKFTTRLLLHFIKVVEIDSEQEVGQVRLVSTINKLAYHCEKITTIIIHSKYFSVSVWLNFPG